MDSNTEDTENNSLSKRTITTQYSDDFERDSLSNTLTSLYSDNFEECTIPSDEKTAKYSENFEDSSTIDSSPDRVISSVRFSEPLETIKTCITDTLTEESSCSSEETHSEPLTGSSVQTLSYNNTSDSTTAGSYSTYQYSEDFEEASELSSRTSESTSVSSRRQSYSESSTSYTESSTYQSTWADSSELSEATSEATYLAEHNFINKLLNRIKHKPSAEGIKKTIKITKERTPLERVVLKSKKTFCKEMIKRVERNQNVTHKKDTKCERHEDSVKLRLLGLDQNSYVENYGVSHQAINRLKLENTKNRFEKMIKEPIHQPRKCSYCLSVLGFLAKESFIKEKYHRVQELLINTKINIPQSLSTLLIKDPVILPGCLQRELTVLSPSAILSRIACNAGADLPLRKDLTEGSYPETSQSALASLEQCPYLQAKQAHSVPIQDDLTTEINHYLQKMQIQVDQVKEDLSDERKRLLNLSSDQFWKTYFSKLTKNRPETS